jgi:hypothetical protein
VTDPAALAAFAADLRASGIGTSTFGVGAEVDETLLTAMGRVSVGAPSTRAARGRSRL